MQVTKNFLVEIIDETNDNAIVMRGIATNAEGIDKIINEYNEDFQDIFCTDRQVETLVFRKLKDMANNELTAIPYKNEEHDGKDAIYVTKYIIKITCFVVR